MTGFAGTVSNMDHVAVSRSGEGAVEVCVSLSLGTRRRAPPALKARVCSDQCPFPSAMAPARLLECEQLLHAHA